MDTKCVISRNDAYDPAPYLGPMNLPLAIPNIADLIDTLLAYGLGITLTLTALRGAWAYLRKDVF